MDKKQVVLYLPPDKHKEFKLAAVAADTSMNAVLMDCVETFLRRKSSGADVLTESRAPYDAKAQE